MAGPGGGSRGGGFSGGSFGGSFGGSHGTGGFSGGFGGGHRSRTTFHSYGPTYYRRVNAGSKGCGCMTVPIILFVIFVLVLIFITGNVVVQTDNYDEATFQSYTNDRYEEIFGKSSAKEDNILLVFLTNEEADGYYTIAWVGDNIKSEINFMFGEYSEYGEAMNMNINVDYFGYSLDTDYKRVIEYMTDCICDLELESNFNSDSDRSLLAKSQAINKTSLEFDNGVVNNALNEFTQKTGIPCVLLVEYEYKVFGTVEDASQSSQDTKISDKDVRLIMIAGGIVIAVISFAAYAVMKNKKKKEPAEKCGERGCDGKADKNEKPPWEY